MLYKLIITIFILTNAINASTSIVPMCNDNLINNKNISLTSFIENSKKGNLSNSNSSSTSSIASTNSNTSNESQIIGLEEQNDVLNENNTQYIISNNVINKVFQSNCIIDNLGINTGIKYLLTLYNTFENLNDNINNVKIINKGEYTNDNDKNKINIYYCKSKSVDNNDITCGLKLLNNSVCNLQKSNKNDNISNFNNSNDEIPISTINDRFCVMVNIAYGIIKTNKVLNLNSNITDEDIEDINDISYTAFYENGLFTKDTIMNCFNTNKSRWIKLLYPLINNTD